MTTALRALGTIILAALVSGFIAGIVQVQLGITYGAQEELIVVMIAQSMFVLSLALALLLVLVGVGTEKAVNLVALAFAALVILGALVIEGASWATGAAGTAQDAFETDVPILIEMVVPALVADLIQWWFVRRHLRKARRVAA